eukprot:g14450.t1
MEEKTRHLRLEEMISELFFFGLCVSVCYFLLVLIRDYVFVWLFLPALLVGRLQRARHDSVRRVFREHYDASVYSEVTIPTHDEQAMLSGACWTLYTHNIPPQEQRWIVWMNANGMLFEDFLPFTKLYSRAVGANVLVFNYRGVGLSTGFPRTEEDLFADGRSVVQYLLKKGVRSQHILLHGHSLGGAVGVRVRSYWPEGPVVNDRSFSSMTAMVKLVFAEELGAIVAAFLCGLFALVALCAAAFAGYPCQLPGLLLTVCLMISLALQSAVMTKQLLKLFNLGRTYLRSPPVWAKSLGPAYRIVLGVAVPIGFLPLLPYFCLQPGGRLALLVATLEYSVFAETLGLLLGYKGYLRWLASLMVKLLRWEMDVPRFWRSLSGHRVLIWHRRDGVIPWQGGSLEHTLNNNAHPPLPYHPPHPHFHPDGQAQATLSAARTHRSIELTGRADSGQEAHMGHLSDTGEWGMVVQAVRVALALPPDPPDHDLHLLQGARHKALSELESALRRKLDFEEAAAMSTRLH